MHVGRSIFFQNLDKLRSDAEVMRTELALADQAESLGFESLWFPEHHFTGYHMCPNVMQMLTYFAGRTTTMRLGSMVVVLPWHDPIRVAEEIAMLDHLSGGRTLLGLGRGLGRVEFDGFRLEMGESRPRFQEYAETMIEAFETGSMAADGKLYQQPTVDIRPEPLLPLRGRLYASMVSPASQDLMISLGCGAMIIPQKPWETTVSEIAAYHDKFVQVNGYEPPKPIVISFVAVHESADGAQEMFERYLTKYALSCVEHYEFANEGLADVPGYEYYGKLAARIAKHGVDQYTEFLAGLQIWGTPESVTEQLVENVRRLDGAGIVVALSYGDMPPDVAERNQELFVREVMPALKAADPERNIPEIALASAAARQTPSR